MRIEISRRLAALAPSATLATVEKANALREQGVDVVDFSAGQPDFDTPQHIKDAAVAALAAGDTKYPSPVSGKNVLRNAVCKYLETYSKMAVRPQQVCVTVGAKDALHLAFAAILNPGDEVIIPAPYWVSYPEHVRLAGGVPVFMNQGIERGGKVTPAEIASMITPRTKALVLNSPSNPTGAFYYQRELLELAALLRKTDIWAVSDEIYHRLTFASEPFVSFATIDGMAERTITVNGWSKTYAMTGWRLGFAAGPEPVIAAMGRLQGQTTSGATSFVQTAAVAALLGDQSCVERMRQAYAERSVRMHAALSAMPGISCYKPDSAFYCFADASKAFKRLGATNADEFAAAVLDRAHVALVSGTAFGCSTHVRLSYATSVERIDEGMRRLAKVLS